MGKWGHRGSWNRKWRRNSSKAKIISKRNEQEQHLNLQEEDVEEGKGQVQIHQDDSKQAEKIDERNLWLDEEDAEEKFRGEDSDLQDGIHEENSSAQDGGEEPVVSRSRQNSLC